MGVKANSSHTPSGELSPSMVMCQAPDDLERHVYLIKNEPAGNKAHSHPSYPANVCPS